jgi:uncharacterized surface protein with fasciclin (FAS1) repeats
MENLMRSNNTLRAALFAIAAAGLSPMASAQPIVGGAPMYPTKDIIDNAVNSADHTTLVAAVKAAGLVDVLKGKGPFTVFAPTNAAFAKLPAGTVETLLKPENKATLTAVLTYHVVAGKFTAADVVNAIKAGGGKAELTTVQGGKLTASMMGNLVMLRDAKGGMSHVRQADVMQSNGVIHVVDAVVLP